MSREAYKRDEHSDVHNMSLPPGKTCWDCRRFERCNKVYGHISADEVCDWSPSRFREKKLIPLHATMCNCTQNERKIIVI